MACPVVGRSFGIYEGFTVISDFALTAAGSLVEILSMSFRYLTLFLISLFTSLAAGLSASAADLTSSFQVQYKQSQSLLAGEQALLKGFDIYLVPGILSEAFLLDDGRSKLTFAGLTGDYFEAQRKVLSEKYGFSVKRLSSSSRSADEIRLNIRNALAASRLTGRKAVFMTHSLGGLALLEELVAFAHELDSVAGIIFLQSPFYGTPIADLYFNNPYNFDKYLKPVLPFLNTSEDILRYLGTQRRRDFMKAQGKAVSRLAEKVPLLTVAGTANEASSLFLPAITVMGRGCLLTAFDKCLGASWFAGPYDFSDGMVPLESSKLLGVDYVVLEGTDHGETVVNIPFGTYDKGRMTEVLFSLLAKKIAGAR